MSNYSNEEFSNEFDILYNNILSNQAPGLTEYEKSVFLTEAEEMLTLAAYGGSSLGDGFEKTEEYRRYLNSLVRQKVLTPTTKDSDSFNIEEGSKYFNVDDDKLWFIIYESVKILSENECLDGKILEVYPVRHDEYNRIRKNPFRGASQRRALRIDAGTDNGIIEIICPEDVAEYNIRFVVKPDPIVLEDLPEGLSIRGVSTKKECTLHPALHDKILKLAVQNAAACWNKK